jgi:phosphate transport system substrate-binding protein
MGTLYDSARWQTGLRACERTSRRWKSILCLPLIVALILAGCSRVETPKVTPVITHLHLAADMATLPLLRALTDAYTASHPTVTFSLQPGNAATVAGMIFSQQADLASVALLPSPVEGHGSLWVADLALDGITIIVNPGNPVSSLTLQQLRDIYSGMRSRWSDLGVAGLGDIDVAVREDGDGTRKLFDNAVMGATSLSLDAVVLSTIEVTMNYVAYQPNAIAYVPSSRITETVTPPVKVIGIEGQYPSKSGISNGNYHLAHTLNLIAASEPQGELRQFVAWALGREGQAVIQTTSYVVIPQAQQ